MVSLADIRKSLKQKSETNSGPSVLYPHFNGPEGSISTVRLLQDGDETNTDSIWVEKLSTKLYFTSTDGEEGQGTTVVIPSLENWGEKCWIKDFLRPMYKENPGQEKFWNSMWPKKSYYFNALIVDGAVEEDQVPENPVRILKFTKTLFDVVKNALMDPELEELITDYKSGRDLRIKKTKKGQYADYTSSSFAMKPRALSKEELKAIEDNGLHVLKDRLGTKPSDEMVELHKEILEAFINGESFDTGRWAKVFN